MRAVVVLIVLALVAITPSFAADAAGPARLATDIPAQELGSALRTLAKERDFQIVYASEDVAGRQTAGARGAFTELEALQKLLDGTGMTYRLLDERTVTVTVATASPAEPARDKPRPSSDRAAAPVLPEVQVSANRERLAAMQAQLTKLAEEFFAAYNRLNTEDEFDIRCDQEVATDNRIVGQVCKPVFVHELQEANLLVPPLDAILAKSDAYEKNVLRLINRYPQLKRIVREQEALRARYETLLLRDSRSARASRSKPRDAACANAPAGAFMPMTVVMKGYALCMGLFIPADADVAGRADEALPEVEINARRESLGHLRLEIVRLEENFYAKYNELNEDDQYDIHCGRVTPTGSALKRRECQPVFVDRAMEAQVQGGLRGYPVQPASSVINRKWPDFEKTLVDAIRAHPELQKLAGAHATMQQHYEAVRKLKFKGKIIVFD